MKRLLVAIVVMAVVVGFPLGSAYALFDDQSTNQDQSQGQLQGQQQGQGQMQGQGQGQLQGQAQAAIAAQGQMQGNLGLQGNEQNSSEENKTYANAWPGLSGGEGVSQANAYSIFGGLGLSSTEKYKVYIAQMQAVEASQSLSASQKSLYISELAQKMVDSNKKQRFLGLFWETDGRNLLNLFGLLSWDSFWKDGQHPFTKTEE